MSNYAIEYKGNAIFRNQPNHSYFDKPFEDYRDSLYLFLNDIHPFFMQPEQQAQQLKTANVTIIDPRTQKPIIQLYHDHTTEEQTKTFISPKRSTINEQQHEMGVQVLNALQQGLNVEEEQLYNWYRLEKTRLKETEAFHKFVCEFVENTKEQVYAPCRKLLELYQNWYKSRVNKLLLKYPQESYNTHLGLPQVRLCKNVLSEQQVQIDSQEVVAHLGNECYFDNNVGKEFKTLNHRIASYQEVYINSEDLKDSLENDLQTQFIKIIEHQHGEYPLFYIPLESLVFLLTAGDYIDTPTEVLLNIKEMENSEIDFNKSVIMELPLPSRQVGWHSYQQVVEQAAIAVLSINQNNATNINNSSSQTLPIPLSQTSEYKLVTLKDFMENCKLSSEKHCNISKTLIKWQLKAVDDNNQIHIYTSLSDSPIYKHELSQHFETLCFKLEYKPQFGCEVMTKYEIIREWLKLKLLQTPKGTCLRLNINNYQTLLQETLTTKKLEDYLSTVYHVNCQQMLNNLFEFLKMLYNMPLGHYMLRFNSKFKDKLMLCKPSQEITQKTIHIHELLQTDVSDLEFLSQQNVLPIDENLCSLMHLQHKILPCAFNPLTVQIKKVLNKKNKRIKQVKTQKEGSKRQSQKPVMNKNQAKKTRRKKRLFAAMKAKNSEQKEIEQEMELERKMLGA